MLAPANLVVVQLLAVGWHATWPRPAGIAWGLLAALFCGVVPYGFVRCGVRRGRWADRQVRDRRERVLPLAVGLASVATGLAALALLGGPSQVFALVIAMLAGLATLLGVTTVWKASLHAAVAAGSAVVLGFVFGVGGVAALPFLAAVWWARVATGDHTPAQVAAGAILGGLAAALVFPLAS